jgi:hypothetical protein
MKKFPVLLAALALSLAFSAPAWALVDLNLSAEYVTGGEAKAELTGSPTFKGDLDGGYVVRGLASVLGFSGGIEYYTDTVDGNSDLTSLALKVGYGLGLPGFDLTLLATYEDWTISQTPLPGGGDLNLKDILLGVDAVITILPVFDVEAWYNTSVSSDVSGEAVGSGSGIDGSGFSYGVRLIYKVAAGFGISGGYRAEEHKIEGGGESFKVTNNGYTLGVDYRF